MVPLVYLIFFLSGAAALVYEVAWARSLQLLFGSSHLAVSAVLSVFMAGLALGSYVVGKRLDSVREPLKLYGLLEIGIAVFAVVFMALTSVYPFLYVPLARRAADNPVYLSSLRVAFAVVAMIVPTTLMGGTLPVLAKFASSQTTAVARRISFLYGFNTLGAVVGTMAAGFVLLPNYSVSVSVAVAIATNISIGLAAILLQKRVRPEEADGRCPAPGAELPAGTAVEAVGEEGSRPFSRPVKIVLWGIGLSGFCALGYEVLWTRILSMVVGASVYGFTVMLVAFLTGIAMGSKAFALFLRLVPGACRGSRGPIVVFGAVQFVIGLTALLVTYFLRDLPSHAIRIHNLLLGTGISEFEIRQGENFVVAFSHMFVPAFFMGFAFPLAGKIHADRGKSAGGAIGEVLAYNTVGAIIGAGVSGFALIHLFGIERSLQFLTIVNTAAGILIALSTRRNPVLSWAVAGAAAASIVTLATHPDLGRMWDLKYFAIYRNNNREAFTTAFGMRDAMENTDVLYYAEGVQATVSSIKVKGGYQAFITNGRIEASDHKEDRQIQYTLGHLPMLLNRSPKRVFVLGTGSGMTLGATSAHPEVEEIVLAEIEPKVVGVARTFSKYNHGVLDNRKLRIVFNDGRNFLMTTEERFDVITADPIHPWFSGAGYLYTREYFRLAGKHLNPGGIVCQWLPLYELSGDDLKSVVRTLSESFRYGMVWLTRSDAALIGSHDPIVIDETELQRRIGAPGVVDDLESVDMGSADEFLSYYVMGTEGMRAVGQGGVLNTDDNLHLEFSAPLSMGVPTQATNAEALYRFRESLLPYLRPAGTEAARSAQTRKWDRYLRAGRLYAAAHVLLLQGTFRTAKFHGVMEELEQEYPDYAPFRMLKGEVRELDAMTPTLIVAEPFLFRDERGARVVVAISAVKVPVAKERAAVVFVDNEKKAIFGQIYVDAPEEELDLKIRLLADDLMDGLRNAYRKEAAAAAVKGHGYPLSPTVLEMMRELIASKARGSARGDAAS